MTAFKLTETVTASLKNTSAALGASTSTPLTDKDIGKAVKLAAADNYVLCADGDPVEGFLQSVEPWTVNGGFGFGTVQTGDRKRAQVATGATVAVRGFVLAAAQAAVGTANANNLPLVKPVAAFADTLGFTWRVISIESGNGSAGSIVVLELVGG